MAEDKIFDEKKESSPEKGKASAKQKMAQAQKWKKVSASNTTWLIVAGLLGVGAIGFYAGTEYQKNQSLSARQISTRGSAMMGQGLYGTDRTDGYRTRGGMMNRGGAFGEVTEITPSKITVNDLRNGSTSFEIDGSTTVVNDGKTAKVSDIQNGDSVMVQTASSSSKKATRIIGGVQRPTSAESVSPDDLQAQ